MSESKKTKAVFELPYIEGLDLSKVQNFFELVYVNTHEKKLKEKTNVFIVINDNKKLDEINIKLDNIQKIITEKLLESDNNIKVKKKLDWNVIKELQDSFNDDDPSAEEIIKMIKNK